MDFVELEAIEGLRWSWNTWPDSKAEAAALVVPLSVICTPLMQYNDLPLLNYDPLHCSTCTAVLNPYARVDYPSRTWICPFCYHTNSFPRSYAGISDTNLPAELFPTYSTVEYQISRPNSPSSLNLNAVRHWSSSPTSSVSPSLFSSSSGVDSRVFWPAFVFVVDTCSSDEELKALRSELLLVLAKLPENARVGLVTFDSMVHVHDLRSSDCSKVVVFHGERELPSEKVCQHLSIQSLRQQPHPKGAGSAAKGPAFLVPVSDCEFTITAAIDDIRFSGEHLPGRRPLRATGAAISTAVGLLEACFVTTGSRVMVFTSGPATVGPATIVGPSLGEPIRTNRDLLAGHVPHHGEALSFYKRLTRRLSDASIVLDLFVSSLDQVGVSELRAAVDPSGGHLVLADSFASDQFRRSLRRIFRTGDDMSFDVTLEVVASSGVKIRGALGPCLSAGRMGPAVGGDRVGEAGTTMWKLCTATPKTSVAFFFEVAGGGRRSGPGPPSAFFLQFRTRYRHVVAGMRKRVTTVARRWAAGGRKAAEVAAGFDQEAAAAVVSRLAADRAETRHSRDVIRWLDKKLVDVCSRFGDYVPEDPASFRLPAGFSLYPQLMYYLRRSPLIEVFDSTPDETAFRRSALRREGVAGTLVMIQPALLRYTLEGPPVQVAPDVGSVSRDSVLLFDSYFHVVILYGAEVGLGRRGAGSDGDETELGRRLAEGPEADMERMTGERVPAPKVIRCDQYSSEARFLLARLSPAGARGTRPVGEIGFSDDLSLQVFVDYLHELAVQA